MQSSYALLMLCQKSRDWNRGATNGAAFRNGLEELYSGLSRVLAALQNYSIAFEALEGMRGKVSTLIVSAFVLTHAAGQIQEAFDSIRLIETKPFVPTPLTTWS